MTSSVQHATHFPASRSSRRWLGAALCFVKLCLARHRDRQRLIACQRLDRRFAQDVGTTIAELEWQSSRAPWRK